MKGILFSLTTVAMLAFALIMIMLIFSFFTGGAQSTSILGWGDVELLSGVDSFVTGIYNGMVFLSSWMTIGVLFIIFVGIQGGFIYVYYRVGKILLNLRKDLERILDELLDI